MRLSDLENAGFDILTENHARAILTNDFPVPLGELCKSLNDLWIADVELVRGGGGEAHSTQRLRHSLTDSGWSKSNIIISKIVDGKERAAITHEIDHVRKTENGAVALEIEWNNKDPFFDRDLENFQRLHSEGAISVGVIVTRGKSLQENLYQIVKKCAVNHGVRSFEDLGKFDLRPTERQRRMVTSSGEDFVPNWARMVTTHAFTGRRGDACVARTSGEPNRQLQTLRGPRHTGEACLAPTHPPVGAPIPDPGRSRGGE